MVTATEEGDVIRQIINLCEYMLSKIIKQEVKLSGVVCPFEVFKSMGVKVIKTQEV